MCGLYAASDRIQFDSKTSKLNAAAASDTVIEKYQPC
jgi:hypothetical protein